MKLSAEMFKQILASLKSDGPVLRMPQKRIEGRVGVRVSVDVATIPRVDKNARPITMGVRDMSVNGIGLISAKALEIKSEFAAAFVRAGHKPLLVCYQVRCVRRMAPNIYSIGAKFQRFEDDSAAQALLGPLHRKIAPRKKLLESVASEI